MEKALVVSEIMEMFFDEIAKGKRVIGKSDCFCIFADVLERIDSAFWKSFFEKIYGDKSREEFVLSVWDKPSMAMERIFRKNVQGLVADCTNDGRYGICLVNCPNGSSFGIFLNGWIIASEHKGIYVVRRTNERIFKCPR